VEGRGAAICTGPLNKETRNSAGHKFPGHTDP
jgi:4-hydroxy-L-threonine phosphate dehydrogenase PdxA